MEVQMQEDHHLNMVIKRRRTKRPRPSSPLALTMATSSSSTVELEGHAANSSSSPSNSGIDEFVKNNSEEEEDMANCLILLAQGHNNQKPDLSFLSGYQCKTCNRCFPSFQALGGHRASHKKTKSTEDRNPTMQEEDVTTLSLQIPIRVSSFNPSNNHHNNNNNNNNNSNNHNTSNNNNSNSNNNIVKNKNRVHECSICGAEFTSGQALGGHMRRHRPLPNSIAIANNSHIIEESHETKNSTRNFLSLDLNLPAPEDDHRETKFSFASKEQVIVFSASPLVDCHY